MQLTNCCWDSEIGEATAACGLDGEEKKYVPYLGGGKALSSINIEVREEWEEAIKEVSGTVWIM
jgi:hypothetical protein